MTTSAKLSNIAVVLKGPRLPENIGASARAMRNMGIEELIVVNPQNCESTRILKMATHAAIDIVEQMRICQTLKEALSSFNFVIGTTARLGKHRQIIDDPAKLAEKLVSISQKNRVALVFGPEDRGLSNEDIRYCHELVSIPTAEFPSLNLAQAVLIMCYEVFTASREKNPESTPRLATGYQLDGMYAQLRDILVRINYISPENPDHWMNRVRQFFTRMELRAKEVSMIRGICRQINWYGKKCYEDGLRKKGSPFR